MATDLQEIVRRLTDFYDFAGRTVIDVGAGGGQLVEYARAARRVVAIDRDPAALGQLAARLRQCGLEDRFTLLEGDFLRLEPRGDVALFEFCLHEIAEPEKALAHARALATDVVVIDHAPGSPWSFLAAEEDGVAAAWAAVEARGARKETTVQGVQRFAGFAELEARLAGQGQRSEERIRPYRGRSAISIEMPYRLALL